MVDVLPPLTTHDYDDLLHNADFYINLSAVDQGLSGVSETYYRINFGPIKTVSANGQPFITTEGLNNIVEFWSKDNDGNTENLQVIQQIKLDKTAPFELSDLSGVNGATVQASHVRPITIFLRDAIKLANTINLNYFRTGYDLVPQQIPIQLDVEGSAGNYLGTLDENPDGTYSVTAISFWVDGFDAAGNAISIGGTQFSPLSQYTVNDNAPIFIEFYPENLRISQTKTVKNMGWASTYIDQQTIELEIRLNKPTFFVSADFSGIDSFYTPGQETVVNVGDGRYRIYYEISASNTMQAQRVPVTITATNGLDTAYDSSFLASTTDLFALVDTIPAHEADNIHIDSSLVLQFNESIVTDGFVSGHIYITDSSDVGILLDYRILNNTVIITPVRRLKPQETYTIHINPGFPGATSNMYHYNEVIFSTGIFYAPLVPAGYTISNASNNPLTVLDTSLKICNSDSVCITWPAVPNNVINGHDLRTAPIMVSDTNSALFWADELPQNLAELPAIIQITNLTDLVYPQAETSLDNQILLLGGLIKNALLVSQTFSANTLTLEIDSVFSLFVHPAEPISFTSDGQNNLIRLFWCIPESIPVSRIVLVRKTTGFPTSINDGITIYDSDGHTWYDIDRPNDVIQYYRLFLFDENNNLYDFIVQKSETAQNDYKISFTYGEYETCLITSLPKFGRACDFSVTVCENAVKDTSNNGNSSETGTPLFQEFRLGRNANDDENPIVSTSGNVVTIKLSAHLAFKVKDLDNMFVVFDENAASDIAKNASPMALFTDVKEEVDPNSHPLLHAIPVERTL